MNIARYLRELKDQGIELSLHPNGQDLSFRAKKGSLTDAIKSTIREFKPQITEHLARQISEIQYLAQQTQFELSPGQKRLWLQEQLDGQANNIAGAVRLIGAIEPRRLEQALGQLVQRHGVFRTRFVQTPDADAKQELQAFSEFCLQQEDLSDLQMPFEQAKARIHTLAPIPFDLTHELLLRATLFKLADDDHVLLINMPHIAVDGVSLAVFDRELGQLYQGLSLPAPELRYVDFAAWSADQSIDAAHEQYWTKQLEDAPLVNLPVDTGAQDATLYQARESSLTLLDVEQSSRLRNFGAKRGATPFMTFLAAFGLALSRQTGEPDLTVATAINHRPKAELAEMVGFFLNILALRIRTTQTANFGELLDQVRQTCLDAYEHQALPFERLVEILNPEREQSRTPLARIAFAFGDTPWMPGYTLKLPGIDVQALTFERGMLDFDMHLWVSEQPQGLVARLEYRQDLYGKDTADKLLKRYQLVMQQIIEQVDRALWQCDGLDQYERDAALRYLTHQPTFKSHHASVLHAFSDVVTTHAHHIAVDCGDQRLDYQQLDLLSSRLAAKLLAQGIRPGGIVGLHLPPGALMVAAMLAAFKCAAAYLPLEVNAPAERLGFVLSDSCACMVIDDDSLPLPPQTSLPVIRLSLASLSDDSTPVPQSWPQVQPDSLAYVMYTSGSTGAPKGVLVPHCAIARLVLDPNYITIGNSDRIAQISNSAFDAFTFEVWGALANAATIVHIERDVLLQPDLLKQQLTQRGVTIAFVTTALFNLLIRSDTEPLAKLRYLLFGGEQSDTQLVRTFLQQPQPKHLVHVYGPTESTTFSTFHPVKRIADHATRIPIGKPIRGTTAVVLADDLALVAPGVTGELFLGGVGLAQGYLERPELNAEKFLVNPHVPNERLYRTGDYVRLNADGEIEFIGRTDNQVKLRGLRIELDEIQAKLLEIEGVLAALVVLDKRHDQAKIVAYVQTERSQSDIRQALQGTLPDYMLPAAIVCMAALPINRNGKIDRQALPDMDGAAMRRIRPARDAVDETLIEIWREFLDFNELSIDDNFFEVGGHSLLAARITARVSDHFKTKVQLRTLFEHPTLERYADWLRQTLTQDDGGIEPPMAIADRSKALLLSSAQERLWFLDQMNPDSPAYNISYALQVSGELNVSALEVALQGLLDRHESLRTRFVSHQGQPHQEIVNDIALSLEHVDLSDLGSHDQEQALHQHRLTQALTPFRTNQAPLMRATLYQLQPQQWILAFCIHHIVADGWSLAVLRHDLGKLYDAALRQDSPDLPVLRAQYADYAQWDRDRRANLDEHLRYWRQQLADLVPLRMPTDYARPKTPGFEGAAHRFSVNSATMQRLNELSTQSGATMFMTLLTAFSLLLQRYTRQNDFAVGSPIAHRNHIDTENLIGFFVNTLVMRCQIDGQDSFRAHLARTRDTTLAAYAHQDLPFERLVQELDPERDPSANPLVQVIFALQNAPVSDQRLHNVNITPLQYMVATTRFDLEMHLWQSDQQADHSLGLSGILVYNTALFAPERMACLCRCFTTLLDAIAANTDLPVSQLNILSPQDRLNALSHPRPISHYPRDEHIAALFAAQASAWPDKTALLLGSQALSYGELDRQSSHLARRLLARNLAPESAVLVQLKPSFEFVISILAILKAGCCYAPIDIHEPPTRLAEIVRDLNPALTIDEKRFQALMQEPADDDTDWTQAPIAAENLAYILFTSGSTGKPKGVRVPHRAVIRLVKNTNFHPFDADQIWLGAASLAFDASTLEIWGALLNGSQLAIVAPGASIFTQITQTIRTHRVTSAWLTAGLFNTIVDTDIDALKDVRYLIAGGDVLSVAHVQRLMRELPSIKLINGYGPTENTTFTCCHVLKSPPPSHDSIPIGQPIANTWVYIVDESLQPVVDGMPGELLAGGDGLARDYLNAADLTASRFIADPFDPSGQQRLYRTGDLVRRNVAGDIEFLGRIDTQVKLRGYRVETLEVEQTLRQHAQVQDVAIHIQGRGELKKMIAYVVPVSPDADHHRSDLSVQQVQDWESLFDGSLYQTLDNNNDPTFNTAGWKSSFTDQPIPTAQMKDWLDDFISVVQRDRCNDILEIGCGTGMVLFRLLDSCRTYVGTDFSKQALAHIERHLPAVNQVTLLQRDAMDISGFQENQFDTVIVNSVIQYFPDSQYLNQVIERCLPLIRDGGRLIIGDIRNYALLEAFHAAVTFARSDSQMTIRQWRAHVSRSLLEEDELLVSPGFFTELALPRIADVRFRLQRPEHDNELSKFRYSVIIEVGSRRSDQPIQWLDQATPTELTAMLERERPLMFGLRNVANSRLALENALAQILHDRDRYRDGSLGSLKHEIQRHSPTGVDPEVWWHLGEQFGYHVDVGWPDGNQSGCYDVVFADKEHSSHGVGVPGRVDQPGLTANMPLRGKLARALNPKLREHCQTLLPDYMVPAQFIMLPALPLTRAGKVDKQALDIPERALGGPKPSSIMADNQLERTITAIWSDLLGIAQPSVTDNFFDLGGHSMLMVQVCNRLKEQLNQDVPVLTMFEHPTIRSLARALNPTTQPQVRTSNTQSADRARKQRESIQRRAAAAGRRT